MVSKRLTSVFKLTWTRSAFECWKLENMNSYNYDSMTTGQTPFSDEDQNIYD